jgi:hypothetical protein
MTAGDFSVMPMKKILPLAGDARVIEPVRLASFPYKGYEWCCDEV